MISNEKVIDYLEEHIPELAIAATQQAYWQALAFGNTVLVTENNMLIEKFPDGSQKIIRLLEPRMKVEQGKKIELK
jgi:hypothetical protein